MVNAGNATNVTISGLIEGANYFFAATAYSILSLESAYSSEISYTPGLPRVKLFTLLNGQVALEVTGQVNHTHEIQGSPNLTGWIVIGTVSVGPSGAVQFADSKAAILPAWFYRVVEQLPKIQIRVSPTRQAILTVTGPVGLTYNIQASPDLATWTVIGTVTLGASNSLDFADTNAPSFQKRFYRTQEKP